ncbi:hypothetical protein GGH12_005663 [Coemansia sp. RSA 1822]|nr:hypothetical protein LPJ76_005856 [Coemansia sp. RSA 638]KAJ2558854.1 hypothetical protein GGH12_005663 [Coemansia sp. RSA 1822]
MESVELEFEAMMAGMTAPPLSLHEFRQFVAHDAEARNALAFCTWHQRYTTVYFDRTAQASTVLSSGSTRPGIPSDFMPTVRKRMGPGCAARSASASAPDFGATDGALVGTLFTLKAHSFGAAHAPTVHGPFLTASTTASSSFGTESAGSVARVVETAPRRAVSHPGRSVCENGWVEEEEERREHVQSLLVFECWARFLGPGARERVTMPDAELRYVTERLPLNITHLHHPLLCRGDMLTSRPSMPSTSTEGKVYSSTESRVHSSAEGRVHSSAEGRVYSSAEGKILPSIGLSGQRHAATVPSRVPTEHRTNGVRMRLVSVGRLQRLHPALRPRPPFATAGTGSGIGYGAVPAHVTRLIHPCNIPPALFDTAAKVAALRLRSQFVEFRQHACYNITKREQRATLVFAGVQLALGVAVAVALMTASVPRAWRMFAIPLLWGAAACASMACMRIYVWRWWRRMRPAALAHRSVGAGSDLSTSAESDLHGGLDPDLNAVRRITGTLDPHVLGMAGTLRGGSAFATASVRSVAACVRRSEDLAPSSPSLWSLGSRAPSCLVRFMLRRHRAGDQWLIDVDAPFVRVLEPTVLGAQCYTLAHHAAVLIVVCGALAIVLFLVA